MKKSDSLLWKVDRGGYELSPDQTRIVRRGGELRTYYVGDCEPSPHALLANLHNQVAKPEARRIRGERQFWERRFSDMNAALLAFVNDYGFLGMWDTGPEAPAESVEYLKLQQNRLGLFYALSMDEPAEGSAAQQFNDYAAQHLAFGLQFTIRLIDTGDEFELRPVPRSLIAWMWLKAAQAIEQGVTWRECDYCRKPMDIGARFGARQGAEFRYCSDSCRVMGNRSRKRAKDRKPKGRKS